MKQELSRSIWASAVSVTLLTMCYGAGSFATSVKMLTDDDFSNASIRAKAVLDEMGRVASAESNRVLSGATTPPSPDVDKYFGKHAHIGPDPADPSAPLALRLIEVNRRLWASQLRTMQVASQRFAQSNLEMPLITSDHFVNSEGRLAAIAALRRHAAICDWYEMEAETGYRQYLLDIRQLALPHHSLQTLLDGANDKHQQDLKVVHHLMEGRRSQVNATIEMIEFIEAHKESVRSAGNGVVLTDPKDESTLQSLARRVLELGSKTD